MSTMADEISDENYRAREQYNGYANRETWAFNLHWQNDQGLYYSVLDAARTTAAQTESDYDLGEFVVNYVGETLAELYNSGNREAVLNIMQDVGSFWRIDYREVGEAVRESLDAES